jgi:peptidyl-prolyl cis-trans isomerase SurA
MKLNNKMSIIAILLFMLVASTPAFAGEVLDGIAATVDDRIILLSEVESQLELLAMDGGKSVDQLANADSLRHEILKQMIDDKLILIEAEKDTTIKVTSEEIDDALNRHIDRIKSQFPTEQAFLTQLSAEGLTLRELRSRYRDEVKNQIYKEMLLNKRLNSVRVSTGEVKEFYTEYADSLPTRPAGVHLAHILIATQPSQATKDSIYAFAQSIMAKIKAGEDFAILAKNFSQDGTAPEGGDLGWFGRGDMVESFEKAAFDLAPGEISDIIETQYGYHIIKCTDKKGDQIRASHILFMFEPTEEDVQLSKVRADSIYQALVDGAPFDSLAMKFSDDETSAAQGGDLGWYAADDLSAEYLNAISGLEVGQFSEPVLSSFGYHILKVLERKDSRPLDYKEDYADIEAIAKRYKAQKELQKWLDEVRDKYYVEIKL